MFHSKYSKQTILGYPHDYGNLHVFLILRIRSPVYSMVEKRGKMFHGTPLFLAQKLPSEEPILDSEAGLSAPFKLAISSEWKLAIPHTIVTIKFQKPTPTEGIF